MSHKVEVEAKVDLPDWIVEALAKRKQKDRYTLMTCRFCGDTFKINQRKAANKFVGLMGALGLLVQAVYLADIPFACPDCLSELFLNHLPTYRKRVTPKARTGASSQILADVQYHGLTLYSDYVLSREDGEQYDGFE